MTKGNKGNLNKANDNIKASSNTLARPPMFLYSVPTVTECDNVKKSQLHNCAMAEWPHGGMAEWRDARLGTIAHVHTGTRAELAPLLWDA